MAEGTFSYDPTKITDGGKDQMRFELGDTVVDLAGISAALCDEEYTAILGKYGDNWRMARFQCLKAIVMKLSHEVDTTVDRLSYNLDQRYKHWKKLLDEEKAAISAADAFASFGNPSDPGKPPYFYGDMQSNPRKI